MAAKNEYQAVKEETYVPLFYFITYGSFSQALAMHNSVPQGLLAAILTDSLNRSETFLGHAGSDCGIANVNIGNSGAKIGGAFGSEKDTDGGRESGSDACKAHMRRQTSTINWGKEMVFVQRIDFNKNILTS